MLAALERAFPDPDMGVRWTRPQGGLFLWVRLPHGLDSLQLLTEAIEQRVAFVPGASFHPDGSGANTLRLNFSHADEAHIEEGHRAPRARGGATARADGGACRRGAAPVTRRRAGGGLRVSPSP